MVYYRCIKANNGDVVPFSYNASNAVQGFLKLGFDTKGYLSLDEVYNKLQRGDIILDGIDQVDSCLKKFGIVIPTNNYPEVLEKYLGRKIWKDTINSIASDPNKWSAGNFVKPIKDKVFTGHIIKSTRDLIGCGNDSEDYEVLVSEPVNFIYECRGFIYYDKMIDLRPYKGHWKNMCLIDSKIIEEALKDWKRWPERPPVCTLDFGVVEDSSQSYRTLLIECNSFSATGCYGLECISYARMINAYFSFAYNIPDEYKFL